MSYGVVRTDKMAGTDVRSELVTVKYMGAGSTETAIENGNVVILGDLVTGEREIYKGTTPAANSALNDVILIASPEVMYDERKHNLVDFRNEAGALCRGYRLHQHDIFSVTADCLNAGSDAAVGNVIELMAGTKLKNVASLTSGSTKIGEIIAKETVGSLEYFVIEVG